MGNSIVVVQHPIAGVTFFDRKRTPGRTQGKHIADKFGTRPEHVAARRFSFKRELHCKLFGGNHSFKFRKVNIIHTNITRTNIPQSISLTQKMNVHTNIFHSISFTKNQSLNITPAMSLTQASLTQISLTQRSHTQISLIQHHSHQCQCPFFWECVPPVLFFCGLLYGRLCCSLPLFVAFGMFCLLVL